MAVRGNAAPSREIVKVVSASVTRPANTTQYAANDLVANNTTAGSVTPLQFTDIAARSGGGFRIVRARLRRSEATTTDAAFTLFLFSEQPTVSNGDNGTFAVVDPASLIGTIAFTEANVIAGSSDAACLATPDLWGACESDSSTVYGLLRVDDTYTPASGEVLTVDLTAVQH